MASGQIFPLTPLPPGSSGAQLDILVGASTPAESLPIAVYADAAAAYIDYYGTLRGYGGGGLTLDLVWSSLATANNAVWQAAFRRIQDDAEDVDTTAHTYDFNTVTAAAPSAAGENSLDSITFTDGADMDSLANGEPFILRVLRDPAHASDNLANTAQLWVCHVVLRET